MEYEKVEGYSSLYKQKVGGVLCYFARIKFKNKLYQIKKDKLLEIRTKKLLKYFQLEDNGKVLFAKKDVEEFMKTYTF